MKALFAKIAAIGGIKRRGFGALKAYGGSVQGSGFIEHKSGPLKGTRTKFKVEGQPASKT